MVLSAAVVDQDARRALYGAPLSEALAAQAAAGPPKLQHLESNTHLMSDEERQRKAEMTEGE